MDKELTATFRSRLDTEKRTARMTTSTYRLKVR